MSKRLVAAILVAIMLLFSMVSSLQFMKFAEANFMYPPLEIIYIKSDGGITPNSALINRVGNIYSFRGDITNYIIEVQCDNIVIDGVGYRLQKTTPAYGSQNGITLKSRTNVTIRNLNIQGFDNGVFVSGSLNCNLSGNRFTENKKGIVLADGAFGNYVSDNKFTSGGGISISYSIDNMLRNNSMEGKGPNFSIEYEKAESASSFINDVDASNTINGKQICYWINQHDLTVPYDSGYVALINCTDISVENLDLTNNGEGILLISSTNSTFINNKISNNFKGIIIHQSEFNSFTSNNIANSTYGILCYSHNNIFKSNCLENNNYDVNFEDRFIDEFDYSNIVDGVPICYWNWQHDKTVPTNVGYVVLLSCSNITIKNLNITHRRQAMLLLELSDSVITRNIIANNSEGIILKGSTNNNIARNLIANNSEGLYLEASHSNVISGNRITYNTNSAIHLDDSNDNIISSNYMSHSRVGLTLNRGHNNAVVGNSILYSKEKAVHLGESVDSTITGNYVAWSRGWAITITGEVGNNRIHHNDFVNNMGGDVFQVYPGAKTFNVWDDGEEGNFWSDYPRKYPTAKEVEGSDIMDIPIELNENNIDRYPLTKPVDLNYQVTIVQPANKTYKENTLALVFFVTAPNLWMGYSLDGHDNMTFQGESILSDLSEGTHKITVYGGEKNNGVCDSETIVFTINHMIEDLSTTQQPDVTPTISPSISPTETQTPSTSPPSSPTQISTTASSPVAIDLETEDYTPSITIISLTALIIVLVVVYFKKRRG